jgi:hypothetical protein
MALKPTKPNTNLEVRETQEEDSTTQNTPNSPFERASCIQAESGQFSCNLANLKNVRKVNKRFSMPEGTNPNSLKKNFKEDKFNQQKQPIRKIQN